MAPVLPPVLLLLLDDDEDQHVLLDLSLAHIGLDYRLDWCSSHQEAFERMKSDRYDLCFVDYLLEDATGIDFIRECLAAGTTAPMVMLTSHGGRELALEALEAGAADYLPKDRLDPDTLERTVRYALERARLRQVVEHERERIARLVESLPIVVWESEYDADGHLRQTFVSDYIETLTGFTAAEWLADTDGWVRLVHPDDEELLEVPEQELARSGTAERRYRIYRRDGSLAWIDVRFSRMHAPTGELLGLRGVALDVTEQMLTEQRLQSSERLFESFMNNTTVLNFIKDGDGRYVFVNEAFSRRVGMSRDEVIGRTDIEIWPEEVAVAFRANDHEVLSAGVPLEFTERVLDGDREILSHVVKFPIHAADGSALLGGIAIDITARVHAEEGLRRREEEYRRIVETAQEGIWVTDNTGVTTFVNATMARMLGRVPEEMLGTRFEVYLDEEARTLARSNKQRREQGLAEQYDLRMLRSDGSIIWTIVSANPIVDRDGSLIGSLAMVADITERKRADEALRASEEKFRRIVETAQEGIWMVDDQDRTTFVNVRMASMLGRSIEDLLGRTVMEIVPAFEVETMRSRLQLRRLGVSEHYELELVRPDGERLWTLVAANPFFGPGGHYEGSLAMVTDITDRRRAELALRDANDRLEQRVQERTAALASTMRQLEKAHLAQKRFVADASHDLRTPLTVVRAELDLLLAQNPHERGTRESLMRAVAELRRLDHLASDLLALATIDSQGSDTQRAPVRLDEVLLESISNLTPIARDKQIAWNIDIDDAVEISCNRPALQRALGNVLENALKYSPRDAAVGVRFSRDGDLARIVVVDSGIGIAQEDLPRIYDRFYRSDAARSTPGTGLGLPIVKSVVEAHGGSVTVDSTQGKGTTVTIELPIDDGRSSTS